MASPHELKAVIHLNNSGVSLLKKRCYRQGMATLADAVSIMKVASGRCEEETLLLDGLCWNKQERQRQEDLSDQHNKINAMLQKADRCLSNPRPSKVEMTRGKRLILISDRDILLLGNSGSRTIESIVSTRTTNNQDQVLRLIQIDALDQYDHENYDLAVESAIALYNYGVAFTCLASLATTPAPLAEKLNTGALQMSQMSYSALLLRTTTKERNSSASCRGEEPSSSSSVGDDHRALWTTWLILRRLVTDNLGGSTRNQAHFHHHLLHVEEEIQAFQDLGVSLSAPASRAA